jgi:DNA-binding CsgD family transcriptional regulator
MPERPRKHPEPENRVGQCSDGQGGCGRITVGKRRFIVSFAPDLPHKRFSTEVCRFELAGRTLIVTETENQRGAKDDISGGEIAGRLTGRELEIAVLVAQGCATKNIAFKLQISEWTVSTYLRRIFAKLDVDSRAAMVYRCAALIDRVSAA